MPQVSRWGRRFRLPGCARPAPISGIMYETRGHGVLFDVALRPVQTFSTADQVIPGFVEPKGFAGKTEYLVGPSCRRTFQPASNRGDWNLGRDEQVDVVRHDHPCVKGVKRSFTFARFDRIGHQVGNWRIFQPCRSGDGPVLFAIFSHEALSRPRIGFQEGSACHSYGSVQPPCQEKRGAFGLKVRQSSSVFGHKNGSDGQAEPPAPPSGSGAGRRKSQRIFQAVGI